MDTLKRFAVRRGIPYLAINWEVFATVSDDSRSFLLWKDAAKPIRPQDHWIIVPPRMARRMSVDCGKPVMASVIRSVVANLWRGDWPK